LFAARRDPASLVGYLELHIEQEPRLAQAGAPVGVVTSIVGIGSYRLAFLGQAGHAGTTPMDARRDASLAAGAFPLAAREIVLAGFPGCVANVGQIHFLPGAFNIIPGRAELALEFRAPDEATLDRLEEALLARAGAEAERFGLGLEVQKLDRVAPAGMSPAFQAAIQEAAALLGLDALPLASFAGHDAQALAPACPVGMVFVPSLGGISHAPAEFTPLADCVNGADVLLQAVLRLAQK
jgi:N-carbamoyl-L-amino-acid hydrolase